MEKMHLWDEAHTQQAKLQREIFKFTLDVQADLASQVILMLLKEPLLRDLGKELLFRASDIQGVINWQMLIWS